MIETVSPDKVICLPVTGAAAAELNRVGRIIIKHPQQVSSECRISY